MRTALIVMEQGTTGSLGESVRSAMAQDGNRLSGWKRWRDGLMIPDQHEPGIQRGFMMGKKNKKMQEQAKKKGKR